MGTTFHWGSKQCTSIWKEITYIVNVCYEEKVCKDNMRRMFSEVID